jgi:hypothetical protein
MIKNFQLAGNNPPEKLSHCSNELLALHLRGFPDKNSTTFIETHPPA